MSLVAVIEGAEVRIVSSVAVTPNLWAPGAASRLLSELETAMGAVGHPPDPSWQLDSEQRAEMICADLRGPSR